jgi:hypothetical protein
MRTQVKTKTNVFQSQLPAWMIPAAVAVILLFLAFLGWRIFGSSSLPPDAPARPDIYAE